jgi:hypothetical protein
MIRVFVPSKVLVVIVEDQRHDHCGTSPHNPAGSHALARADPWINTLVDRQGER